MIEYANSGETYPRLGCNSFDSLNQSRIVCQLQCSCSPPFLSPLPPHHFCLRHCPVVSVNTGTLCHFCIHHCRCLICLHHRHSSIPPNNTMPVAFASFCQPSLSVVISITTSGGPPLNRKMNTLTRATGVFQFDIVALFFSILFISCLPCSHSFNLYFMISKHPERCKIEQTCST
jgi:hypothetical protein